MSKFCKIIEDPQGNQCLIQIAMDEETKQYSVKLTKELSEAWASVIISSMKTVDEARVMVEKITLEACNDIFDTIINTQEEIESHQSPLYEEECDCGEGGCDE